MLEFQLATEQQAPEEQQFLMSGKGAGWRTYTLQDEWPMYHELLPKGWQKWGEVTGSDPVGCLGGWSSAPSIWL